MSISRKEELLEIFKSLDKNVLTIVEPMIDDLIFIEDRLKELRQQAFIKYHPKDPSIQKVTPASKQYKELLAQQKDIVRILCSQLSKGTVEDGDDPLDRYFKNLGKT